MAKWSSVWMIVRYAAVAGVLVFGSACGIYYTGHHPLLIAPFLDFRIIVFGIFLFFSLKEYRSYYKSGVLYFWEGMIRGLSLVLIASAVASLGVWLFGLFEPDFVQSYISARLQYLKTFPPEVIDKIGKETYERNLSDLPSTDSAAIAIPYFGQGLIIGFFITIIMSIILRKQPKN